MKRRIIVVLLCLALAGLTVIYWHFRANHVTVRFHNTSSLGLSRVALSYRCDIQTGADAIEHIPPGRTATITFPSDHMASYSFVVTFSDGTTLVADERLAFGGYAATESVSHSESLYTADSLSYFFEPDFPSSFFR